MTSNTTRTPSTARPAPAPLRCEPGEVIHVGVDVHKATYHVALLSDRRGLVATWVQPARPELLAERLTPLREAIAQVVYEAGPTGFALVRRLRADGFRAEVIAPAKTPVTPGAEPKTDRLDCRRLAVFAQKGLLQPVRVPTEQEEADRQVLRLREQLVRKSRSVQQQIKAFLLQHGIAEPKGLSCWSDAALKALRGLDLAAELRFCLDVMLDELDHARGQVARVTKRLRELARAERHRPAVADLQSVPGVGPITAMTFRLELPEPERFEHQGQVARMIGPGAPGHPERADPPLRPGPEVGQRPAADGPGRVGLEVGRPRRVGRAAVPPAGGATPAAARRRSWRWRAAWGCCSGG